MSVIDLEQVAGTTTPARAASAASLGNQRVSEADGILAVSQPGQWAQATSVGFAAQASTSKAANAAARHVCTSICAIFSTGATAQATAMDVTLRDGATGAGTILWTQRFILDVNKTLQFILTGLNIIGTLNTAMTLEFAAAGVAGSVGSVAMSGYDAS